MQKRLITLLTLPLLAVLAACGPVGTNENDTTDTPPVETLPPLAANPGEGQGALTGQVVNTSATPMAETQVWLATIYWDEARENGAFFIDGSTSPTTFTRADGSFVLDNLTPADYVIVVGDLYGQNTVMSNPDGSARIYSVAAGDVMDAGTLEVDWATAVPIQPLPDEGYPGSAPVEAPDPYP